MSNKHKHYDKIVAKAANVGLVQFIKINGKWEDAGLSDKFISFSEGYDSFLCLPQHKEACLHWLNGGGVQQSLITDSSWITSADVKKVSWMPWTSFMKDELKFRIKPKKEKRLIGVGRNAFTTAHYSLDDRPLLETTIQNLCPDAAVIEIEVEV